MIVVLITYPMSHPSLLEVIPKPQVKSISTFPLGSKRIPLTTTITYFGFTVFGTKMFFMVLNYGRYFSG
jgi:hypothetical protein